MGICLGTSEKSPWCCLSLSSRLRQALSIAGMSQIAPTMGCFGPDVSPWCKGRADTNASDQLPPGKLPRPRQKKMFHLSLRNQGM